MTLTVHIPSHFHGIITIPIPIHFQSRFVVLPVFTFPPQSQQSPTRCKTSRLASYIHV